MADTQSNSLRPRASTTISHAPSEGSLHRVATVVWLLQALLFFAVAAVWALAPACLVAWGSWPSELCLWATPSGLDRLAVAAVRLRLPFALAFGLASIFAAMREDAEARGAYARAFSATFAVWAAVDVHRVTHGVAPVWLVPDAVFVLPFLANVAFALGIRAEKPRWRRLSGTASTLPPGLWLLWAAQGLACVAAGVAVTFFTREALLLGRFGPCAFDPHHHTALCAFLRVEVGDVPDAAVDALRMLGGPGVGLGLLSWSAMRAEHEWLWRMYAQSAAIVFGAWFLAVFVTFVGGGGYSPVAGVLFCAPPLALAVANLRLAGPRRESFAEDVGEQPEGWILMDLFTGPMLAVQSLLSGRRSTHVAGAGAKGTFTVLPRKGGPDAPERPDHEFFAAGKGFPAVVRFSNVTWRDQAALDVRGCALRLALPGEPSPFDLGMNTGAVSPTPNVVVFATFVLSKWLPKSVLRKQLQKSWRHRETGVIGLRRAPDCYSTLRYYSQTVRLWVDPNDTRWLVRYRLVPADPEVKETGLPDERDYAAFWERGRRPEEKRPTDYLSQELTVRLEGPRTLSFRFQGQFHKPAPGDGTAWFNSTVEWPEDTHPWVDIAAVVLESALEEDETEVLEFNAGNHPGSLAVPMSPSAFDYRSLADSERRIIRRLQALRRWRYGVFGLPQRIALAPRKKP